MVCPPAADLVGCTCQEAWSDESGLDIDCREAKLNDARVEGLLKALLETGVSPAVTFDASKNNLTKVPDDLSKLSKLTYIDMSDNQITSIPSGAFQSSSTKEIGIYLSKNRISSLSRGAFKYPAYAQIVLDLSINRISAIPAGVFEGNVP